MEKMRDYEFEFLNDFDINSIDLATKEGRWTITIHEWEKTDAKTLRFTLHNAEEKNACRSAVMTYIRNHKLDWTVYSERNKYNIYVVRA